MNLTCPKCQQKTRTKSTSLQKMIEIGLQLLAIATELEGAMTDLSLAAQAAAAMRAASSQLTNAKAIDQLHAIAAELEGAND